MVQRHEALLGLVLDPRHDLDVRLQARAVQLRFQQFVHLVEACRIVHLDLDRDRTVDVCVRRLRDKIDKPASKHTFIQTRYGVGYKLEPVPKT